MQRVVFDTNLSRLSPVRVRLLFHGNLSKTWQKKAVREKPRIVGQNEGVSEGVNHLYEFICDHPGKRTSEITKVLNVPQKTIERRLHKLKAEQKITFVGSPKTGGYEKNTK